MAKINVNDNIEGGVGGAEFVQQGTDVANTLAPDAIAAIAEGAAEVFTIAKKGEAETASKSLLEELTGNQRLLDIAQRESDVFEREEGVVNEIADSPDVQGNATSIMAMNQIQGMKDQLSREREAVVQGLLTNDEYRIRAEQSFYQIVAMTPGIKTELAAVMGEHLGIDPRGQTAAVTMAARDDVTEASNTAMKKILGEIVKAGFFDDNLSERANIVQSWDHVRQGLQATHELSVLAAKLDGQKGIDDAEKRVAAKQADRWIVQAEQGLLKRMGQFKGLDLFSLTPSEVAGMDVDTRAQWAAHIQAEAVGMSGVLNSLETSTEKSYATNRDTIDQQQELLLSIINSDQVTDILTANLAAGNMHNDILVAAAQAQIAMTQPQAVQLSAYAKFFPITNMIGVNLSASTMVLQGLNGDVPNLANLNEEDLGKTQDFYTQALQGVSQSYIADPKKLTDQDINNAGNTATMVAKQDPADIESIKPSLQLFRLTAQPDFMKRLATVDAVKAQKLAQGVIKHQKAVGQNYNAEINTVLEAADAEKLDSLDFHIEKIEDKWMVIPNTDVDEDLKPFRQTFNLPGQQATQSKKDAKRDAQVIAERKDKLVMGLNRTRGMITNMVESRAATTGLPLAEAAKQVAIDLGISTVDGTADVPGFAEQSGLRAPTTAPKNKTAEEEQRENDDFQPKIDGKRGSPIESVPDGVYNLNGNVFQVKNGDFVELPDE